MSGWDFDDVGKFGSEKAAEDFAKRNGVDPRDIRTRDKGDGIELVVVTRDGAGHGHALAHAVREQGALPQGVRVFVHGVAEMVKELRRYLFVEQGLAKEAVSISGYWRTGCTEDQWQAGKRDFT